MKKNKILVLSIMFQLVLHSTLLAQIDNQKKLINELFYNIPLSNERFDIKAILNSSENFYEFSEYKKLGLDNISIKFEENQLLNFLGKENSVLIYFKPDGTFDQIVILSNYMKKDILKCKSQVDELLKMFSEVSFEGSHIETKDGNNNLIGRGYTFFSSSNTLKKSRGYIYVGYTQKHNEDYALDIHFYPHNLY